MEENKHELMEIVEKPVPLIATAYGKRLYVQLSQPLCCISLKKKDACVYIEDEKCLVVSTMKNGQQHEFTNVDKETAEQVIVALMRFNTGLMDASNTKKHKPIFSPETWQRLDTLCSLIYSDAKKGICNMLNLLCVAFVLLLALFVILLLW